MTDFLNTLLPDKIVVNDIENYLNKTSDKHFFSDIYEGRTPINPNGMIEYYCVGADVYTLYSGTWGLGFYIDICYSTKEQKYIYYQTSENTKHEIFKSENWEEFHTYVRKDLYDMFIWFNDQAKLTNDTTTP
jgi:hypothetical protein